MSSSFPENHEEQLKYTQTLRHRFINELTEEGSKIPTTAEDRDFLLRSLNDMDRTTLGTMKIKVDDQAARENALVAKALLQLGKRVGNTRLFEVPGGTDRQPPMVNEDLLPKFEPVPGQTSTEPDNTDYKEFSRKFKDRGSLPIDDESSA